MTGVSTKITDFDKSLISIQKTIGKPLTFHHGEMVKAQVVDLLADGGVTLNLKGRFLAAKTEIPLLKDSTVLFKVLHSPGAEPGTDLRLQFRGYAGDSAVIPRNAEQDVRREALGSLLKEFAGILSNGEKLAKDFPELLEKLLKTLPPEPDSLPKEMRLRLQDLLKTSMGMAGKDVQMRIERLAEQLRLLSRQGFLPEGFTKGVAISMQELSPETLKNAIENTGVVLEARLKAMLLDRFSSQAPEEGGPLPQIPVREGVETTGQIGDGTAAAQNDLKAGLMRLRTLLMERGEERGAGFSPQGSQPAKTDAHEDVPVKELLLTVNGVLRDIEAFQLLSRTTDSFYTFLPVLWKEMREGDIAFKRGPSTAGGRSYYCMLNLEFDRLGSLSIMIMMQNREFFLSLKAADPRFRSILEGHSGELESIFRDNGLSLKAVHVLDSEDKSLTPFERLDNLESVLNITI